MEFMCCSSGVSLDIQSIRNIAFTYLNQRVQRTLERSSRTLALVPQFAQHLMCTTINTCTIFIDHVQEL